MTGTPELAIGESPQEPGLRLPPIRPRVWLMLAAYLGISWTIVLTSLWHLTPAAGAVAAALAIYTTIPLVGVLATGGFRCRPGAAFRLWVLRPLWYAQATLLVGTLVWLVGFVVGVPFGAGVATAQSVVIGAVGLLLVAFSVGYLGSRRLMVREVAVAWPGLPEAFDGFRIGQISDLHVGPHLPPAALRRIAATLERLAPDLVAVTGDLVDDHVGDTEEFVANFGRLSAPAGVFVIPGNHDVYAGWPAVEHHLISSTNYHVLVNRAHTLRRGGASLSLVGTGDPAAGRPPRPGAPDVASTLADITPGTAVVALAHNPSLWPAIAERGVGLTLSGHTHWGQFALPRLGWCLASPFLRHAMGGYREGGSLLYVNPGTGYWGIPFRIGAFAEITIVTLRRGEVAAIDVGPARPAR